MTQAFYYSLYNIFSKIWSNPLAGADDYCIRDYTIRQGLYTAPMSSTCIATSRKMGIEE
jgi:hypothetical protein